jgi:hypothetical protein
MPASSSTVISLALMVVDLRSKREAPQARDLGGETPQNFHVNESTPCR